MESFDGSVLWFSLPYLWKGLQYSLFLTFTAMVGGIICGSFLAMARLSGIRIIERLASLYVNFFRSIPLILVIFWLYFLVPLLLQGMTKTEQPITIGPDQTALISFILFESAYYCEIIRAGIQSVPSGQRNAAKALGLNYLQQMRYVIMPQAFHTMLPVLLTQTIVLFQDTSLVYVISGTDFLGAASKIAQRDSRLVEMYTFVALVYFILCYLVSQGVKRLQHQPSFKV